MWLGGVLLAQVPVVALAQSGTASTDSITTAEAETRYVRGVERAEQHGGSAARSVVNGILFVPRIALDGVLFATTQTAQLVDDAKLVSRTSAFFFGDDRTWVWYPALAVGTGAGIGGGAFVSYRGPRLTTTLGGIYGGTERFEASIRLDKEFETGSTLWHVQASGKVRKRPDLEFYGFGANPLTDPRNSFSPDATAPFGIYKQRLTKAQLIVGMRPSPVWEFFTTSYFLDRDLEVGRRRLSLEMARANKAGDTAGFTLLETRMARVERLEAASDPQIEDYLWTQQAQINQPLIAYGKLRVMEGPMLQFGADSDPIEGPKHASLGIVGLELLAGMFIAYRAVKSKR